MNFSLPTTIKPSAVATAERNADKAERQGYSVSLLSSTVKAGIWKVSRPDGLYYVVNVPALSCECEQCKREAYCKHLELARREEALWEAEAEYEASEEGRFFMQECHILQMAEVAGAWGG
jgi:hypothetical protein